MSLEEPVTGGGGDQRGDMYGRVSLLELSMLEGDAWETGSVVGDAGIWEGGPHGCRKHNCLLLSSSPSLHSSGKILIHWSIEWAPGPRLDKSQ